MTAYQRVHALINGGEIDRTPFAPIFMLFAARLIQRSYADYVRDHRVLVEAQLRMVERFGVDIVSVISDAWREASACGAELIYREDAPPHCLTPPLRERTDLARLRLPHPYSAERMRDRLAGCALLRDKIGGEISLMGWVEGPIAEGGDLRGSSQIMLDLHDEPGFARDLFEFITEMEIAFARAQIEAGADLIGLGDSLASLISPEWYADYVLPYERRIFDAVHAAGAKARLHICGDTNHLLALMPQTGADIIDLDWQVDLVAARQHFGPKIVIAGNFDPVAIALNSTPAQVYQACRLCHQAAGEPYLLAAGCEIPPATPHPNVEAMRSYALAEK